MKKVIWLTCIMVISIFLFCHAEALAKPSKERTGKQRAFKSIKVPVIPDRHKKTVAVVPAHLRADGKIDDLSYMFLAAFEDALVNSGGFRVIDYDGKFNWIYQTMVGKKLAQKAGYNPAEIATWPIFKVPPEYIISVSSNDIVGDTGGVLIAYADKNRTVATDSGYTRRFSSIRIWDIENMQTVASFLCEANGITLSLGGMDYSGSAAISGQIELTKAINKQFRTSAEKCLKEVVYKLNELPTTYRVVKIEGKQNVKIDGGSNAGIKENNILSVNRNGKIIGNATITSCQNLFCDANTDISVQSNDSLVENFAPPEKKINTSASNKAHARNDTDQNSGENDIKTNTSGVYCAKNTELYFGSETPYLQHDYVTTLVSHGSNTKKALANLSKMVSKNGLDGAVSVYCDFTHEGATEKAVLFTFITAFASTAVSTAIDPRNPTATVVSPTMYSHHFCEAIGFRYSVATQSSNRVNKIESTETVSREIHRDNIFERYIARTKHPLPDDIPSRIDLKTLSSYMADACRDHLNENMETENSQTVKQYRNSMKAALNSGDFNQFYSNANHVLGMYPADTSASVCASYAQLRKNNLLKATALLNKAEGSFIGDANLGYIAAQLSYLAKLEWHAIKHLSGLATNEAIVQTAWEKESKLAKRKKTPLPNQISWANYSANANLMLGLLANKWEGLSMASPYFTLALARDPALLSLLEDYKTKGILDNRSNISQWKKRAEKNSNRRAK